MFFKSATALSLVLLMTSVQAQEDLPPNFPELRLSVNPLYHSVGLKLGHVLGVIPNPIDQNPWAHWRSPMDMMRQGWSTSLFHAAQQWSTRSS